MMDAALLRRIAALEETLERLRKVDRPGLAVSYTPTYYGSSSVGVTTYTTQVGAYISVGQYVHVVGFLVWTAATGTGNVRISLPLASANVSAQRSAAAVFTDGVTFAGSGVQGLLFPNSNELRLFSPASNAASTELSIETAGQLSFAVSYFKD